MGDARRRARHVGRDADGVRARRRGCRARARGARAARRRRRPRAACRRGWHTGRGLAARRRRAGRRRTDVALRRPAPGALAVVVPRRPGISRLFVALAATTGDPSTPARHGAAWLASTRRSTPRTSACATASPASPSCCSTRATPSTTTRCVTAAARSPVPSPAGTGAAGRTSTGSSRTPTSSAPTSWSGSPGSCTCSHGQVVCGGCRRGTGWGRRSGREGPSAGARGRFVVDAATETAQLSESCTSPSWVSRAGTASCAVETSTSMSADQ